MQGIASVQDANVAGKKVLVRVDFNVPLFEGKVVDDARILAALPTLKLLLEKGASSIVVLTHLGRPEGRVVESLRIAPVAARLRELIPDERVVVKENLRFNPGEETNDMSFAQELAAEGDIYVNEAFSNAHRTHASMVLLPSLLPSFAGLTLMREVEMVSTALTPPEGSVAVIGGAKFETKIPLIERLLGLYSEVLLGGALANDMLKARGQPFGASLVSETPVPVSIAENERLLVPTDAIFSVMGSNTERSGMAVDVRKDESLIDIGPITSKKWSEKVAAAPFVLWNGPLGIYEKGYCDGTDSVARTLVEHGVHAVVGGGDTAAALTKHAFNPELVFVSTGGGAMLQFLADGSLPALEALKK